MSELLHFVQRVFGWVLTTHFLEAVSERNENIWGCTSNDKVKITILSEPPPPQVKFLATAILSFARRKTLIDTGVCV